MEVLKSYTAITAINYYVLVRQLNSSYNFHFLLQSGDNNNFGAVWNLFSDRGDPKP